MVIKFRSQNHSGETDTKYIFSLMCHEFVDYTCGK